jgi:DNA-binding Lrp family transcriptional regulator
MKKRQLSEIEKKVLAVIQKGFPNSLNPYEDMATQAGIDTEEFLHILEKWKKDGALRRAGAIVNQFKAGFGASAMVVWKVDPVKIEKAGQILAGFKEVSHAYEREIAKNWPYNLYTMVHCEKIENLKEIVSQMSEAAGIKEYKILLTERELKKVPPTYV